jgi:hypothetical protein
VAVFPFVTLRDYRCPPTPPRTLEFQNSAGLADLRCGPRVRIEGARPIAADLHDADADADVDVNVAAEVEAPMRRSWAAPVTRDRLVHLLIPRWVLERSPSVLPRCRDARLSPAARLVVAGRSVLTGAQTPQPPVPR